MAPPFHSSFPLSPPSSCHGGGVLQFATRAATSPFASYCRAPAARDGGDDHDHDAGILQALAFNGNGSVHGVLDPGVEEEEEAGDGGGGGRRGTRIRARDCAKRIMGLPVEERVKVLDLLQRDDGALTVSDYNDILSALAMAGDHDSAVALFRALRPNGVTPDAQSYATAVQCLCRKGAPDEAKEALDEMVARGFRPTVATFSAVVGCLCKRGRVTRAMEVFDTMRAVGCEPTIRTYNSLIGGLCYVGRLEEALDLLNKLKESRKQTPDIYTFTIVLDGFCKVGRTDEATPIFHDAVREWPLADDIHLQRPAQRPLQGRESAQGVQPAHGDVRQRRLPAGQDQLQHRAAGAAARRRDLRGVAGVQADGARRVRGRRPRPGHARAGPVPSVRGERRGARRREGGVRQAGGVRARAGVVHLLPDGAGAGARRRGGRGRVAPG
uniref:Pentacotripeptide-repeat region of PRORP domain-containing protein n=1 Tax=Oryza glaberrima TaxID=4538 RepID=I1PB31_ORYGL